MVHGAITAGWGGAAPHKLEPQPTRASRGCEFEPGVGGRCGRNNRQSPRWLVCRVVRADCGANVCSRARRDSGAVSVLDVKRGEQALDGCTGDGVPALVACSVAVGASADLRQGRGVGCEPVPHTLGGNPPSPCASHNNSSRTQQEGSQRAHPHRDGAICSRIVATTCAVAASRVAHVPRLGAARR